MSITNELREWASVEVPYKYGHQLLAIADRIDAEHERLMQEQPFTVDMVPMTDERMAEHGWMRLPKDADGEYIHVGDVMEWPDGEKFEVVGIGSDTLFYAYDDNYAEWTVAHTKRHHHAPTVEDVLREFGRGWHEQMNAPETFDIADYVERYAAKLRLKEDA